MEIKRERKDKRDREKERDYLLYGQFYKLRVVFNSRVSFECLLRGNSRRNADLHLAVLKPACPSWFHSIDRSLTSPHCGSSP